MSGCKAILWDVYGTLIAAARGDLNSLVQREAELRVAFQQTVHNFSLRIRPENLHHEFLRLIAEARAEKREAGAAYPEVHIEEIWLELLEEAAPDSPVTIGFAQEVALFFERQANPKHLMPYAYEILLALHQRGLRQGIISNAQFYTPVELSELLRAESGGRISSYESLFDLQLVFFSYQLGVSKPDLTAFRLALERLLADGIDAAECLVIGDSPETDINPARAVGMQAWRVGSDGDVTDLRQILDRL